MMTMKLTMMSKNGDDDSVDVDDSFDVDVCVPSLVIRHCPILHVCLPPLRIHY